MNWPDLTMRPITTWPGARTPDHEREQARFNSAFSTTLRELADELRRIDAVQVVLEVAIPSPNDWRQDGKPRAHARADHPGVVLAFRAPVAPGKELRYGTDRFTSWQDNLRAIVLALHDLRRLERYGIASRGEQYTGFAQLPAPDTDAPRADRGAELVREHGGLRPALAATHPDHGGDPADFRDVTAYRDGGGQ